MIFIEKIYIYRKFQDILSFLIKECNYYLDFYDILHGFLS